MTITTALEFHTCDDCGERTWEIFDGRMWEQACGCE